MSAAVPSATPSGRVPAALLGVRRGCGARRSVNRSGLACPPPFDTDCSTASGIAPAAASPWSRREQLSGSARHPPSGTPLQPRPSRRRRNPGGRGAAARPSDRGRRPARSPQRGHFGAADRLACARVWFARSTRRLCDEVRKIVRPGREISASRSSTFPRPDTRRRVKAAHSGFRRPRQRRDAARNALPASRRRSRTLRGRRRAGDVLEATPPKSVAARQSCALPGAISRPVPWCHALLSAGARSHARTAVWPCRRGALGKMDRPIQKPHPRKPRRRPREESRRPPRGREGTP